MRYWTGKMYQKIYLKDVKNSKILSITFVDTHIIVTIVILTRMQSYKLSEPWSLWWRLMQNSNTNTHTSFIEQHPKDWGCFIVPFTRTTRRYKCLALFLFSRQRLHFSCHLIGIFCYSFCIVISAFDSNKTYCYHFYKTSRTGSPQSFVTHQIVLWNDFLKCRFSKSNIHNSWLTSPTPKACKLFVSKTASAYSEIFFLHYCSQVIQLERCRQFCQTLLSWSNFVLDLNTTDIHKWGRLLL